ncbi:MAG: hypothetical protein FD137_1863 [Spirochaetes bacterium]|nr:MAG: hypothetical protein FD137_1863 [Spirochaetota bacterium]
MKAGKNFALAALLLFAIGILAAGTVEVDLGAVSSRIGLSGSSESWQFGPRVSISQEFSPFGTKGLIIPSALVSVRFQSLAASRPGIDGSLYRAWQALGLGAFLGARHRLDPIEVSLHGGGFLNLSKYTGTGLLGAHPSLAGTLGATWAFSDRVTFKLSLPLEYAWKAGAGALSLGVSAGLQIRGKP